MKLNSGKVKIAAAQCDCDYNPDCHCGWLTEYWIAAAQLRK